MTTARNDPGTHYQLWRIRTDNWNRLRDCARRLARGAEDATEAKTLESTCGTLFDELLAIEGCFAFPGRRAVVQIRRLLEAGDMARFFHQTNRLVRLLTTGTFRRLDLLNLRLHDFADLLSIEEFSEEIHKRIQHERRPYFDVMVVDDLAPRDEVELQRRFRELRRADDEFIYETVVVRTFELAVRTVLANATLQTCILRYTFPFREGPYQDLAPTYRMLGLDRAAIEAAMSSDRTAMLGQVIQALRPELDLFLVSDAPVEDVIGSSSAAFRRVFYQAEDYEDLHMTILKSVDARFETPFFSALQRYALKPTGVFHAHPIARGKSLARSHWLQDVTAFYGYRAFQGESSATTGGLDSLLQPKGVIKEAQEKAARAFGAANSFFVTNGTSTANKIVMQSLARPGDIVLLSHDCHKSHPYAVILAGAYPVYLDAYPLSEYSMYGGVSIEEIKRRLLTLRREGKLDRVKLLLLTNITFDGVTYDPLRVMEEVLAIKPDMVFLWDEAWFAYGRFSPVLRTRTSMDAARRLRERFASPAYAERYDRWRAEFDALDPDDDATWIDTRLLPDPRVAKVRVYATHSTHKTLTSLRQGSMIHVADQEFEHGVRTVFNEAYMTHTSTSPNLQIIGTLDAGRRQVELEGYDLVQRSIQLAMLLRERIRSDPILRKYFYVLGPGDMIPAQYRKSGIETFYHQDTGWTDMEDAWITDEFVLDPTRVTVHIGRTGMDGDQFKQLLMDEFDIQVNKTSRNTVLFMIHIGMGRGMVAHLVKVLVRIASDLDDRRTRGSAEERLIHEQRVKSLVEDLPPLPFFSCFHEAFQTGSTPSREGDMRAAFFLAYDDATCEYLKLNGSVRAALESGRRVVSASFVTPYPPGFPVLVPGQVITNDILSYLRALDVTEIHGYQPAYGLRVFREEVLARLTSRATARPQEALSER